MPLKSLSNSLLAPFAFLGPIVALSLVLVSEMAVREELFDVVIARGRVMDPESGVDGVRNVGITGGKIRAISENRLIGKKTIDAKGLVVAPGFIDLHEHGQEPRNYEFQLHDGVTTSLELELGTADVAGWYADREGKSLINFGVSIGHIPVRMKVMHDGGGMLPIGDAAHREASPSELAEITAELERGFREGALAEGMGVNYTSAATHSEIVEVFRAAARNHASVHVHLRYAGVKEPSTGLSGIEEVNAAAVSTGAGRTELQSAIFDPGWQESMGVPFKDIQWAETGERLTPATFETYRKKGGVVVVHSIPEEAARTAVSNPIVMIASDGMRITGPKVHPRGQGTFSRVLGRYVREEKVLDLMLALRKMTLMPAQRLEKRAPMFKDKGRIRVGADADIAVFDPASVIDKATYDDPLQNSEGIQFVLVNGALVLKDGQLVDGVFPGRPARAPVTN